MKEHCGLFGIYKHADAARLTYFGLYAQQHRGQEGAGIVTWDGSKMRDKVSPGLVHDIFNEQDLSTKLVGDTAIGHVRYGSGPSSAAAARESEPFLVRRNGLQLAIAHNGAILNGRQLRKELENQGAIFYSSTDSELFAHLIVRNLDKMGLEESIRAACAKVIGAYSIVILANDVLIALRDPLGVRPLCLGKLGNSPVIASETCAFDLLEAEFIRFVRPGEILVIKGFEESCMQSYPIMQNPSAQACNPDWQGTAHCIFELVYFARPDSTIFNQNVYMARKNMGIALAKEAPVEADLVMPFPDSGVYCAVGYAQASGLPYEHALIRNHYVGRTFIQPTQDMRDFSVRVKLNPVQNVIKGKRIVIVDDSIVRGTTMRIRVKKLRELGAKEIHCRISCPPVRHPCFYGVDFASRGELIASKYSKEEVAKSLGLDSLHHLSLEGMLSSVVSSGFCLACFDGKYPIPTGA